MLPGFTPALLGEGLTFPPPALGVDQFTVSLMKFDGWYGAPLAGPALVDYAKPSRTWANSGGAGNQIIAMRYGGTSLYSDGTGISSPASDTDYDIVPGQDFTIDFWGLPSAVATDGVVMMKPHASGYSPYLFFQTGSRLAFYASSNNTAWDIASGQLIAQSTWNSSTWTHCAVQRRGNVWTTYQNGVLQATWTSALNPANNTGALGIGRSILSGTSPWTGYIDELRFSKVARYSGNFTPQYYPYFPPLGGKNDAATRLLLHAEDMNDRSAGCALRGPHPVYFNGTAVTSTAQAKFGSKSFKFDGTANCMVWVPSIHAADMQPRDNDWTIDFWYYRISGANSIFATRSANSQYASLNIVDNGTNFFLYASQSGNAWDAYNGIDLGAIPSNQWVHFALVHSNDLPAASGLRSFINGALTKSYNLPVGYYLVSLINDFAIGSLSDLAGPVCYMDEIRFSNVARWTANFTPPTAPYGPDTDPTVLLLHFEGANGSTAIVDSSPAAHGTAGNANVTISTAQAKFGSSSALFNGSNAFCYFPYSPDWDLGNGDWTIDYWEYRTANTAAQAVLCRDGNISYSGFLIGYNAGATLNFYASRDNASWGVASAVSMGPVVLNQWHHFAVVRRGNTLTTYRDGVQISQITSALACGASVNPVYIGYYVNNYYQGYLDELRISRCARWTTPFTPPTAPYTGTEPKPDLGVLLLHCDGAQGTTVFNDASLVNRGNASVFGTAKVSTAQSKFGGSSAAFDGSQSCYLQFPDSPDWAFNRDFTVDCWVWATANPPTNNVFAIISQYEGPDLWVWYFDPVSGIISVLQRQNGAADVGFGGQVAGGISLNTWHHLALTRSGDVWSTYCDGVLVGRVTVPIVMKDMAAPLQIGIYGSSGYNMNGFIDELRIANGVRWTANFTPPTAPYS